MVTRFQYQQPQTGHRTPTSQRTTSQTGAGLRPQTTRTTTFPYTMETELLGVRPRLLRRNRFFRFSGDALIQMATFLVVATSLIDVRPENKSFWFRLSIVPIYIAAQIWIHGKFGDRERDLLRYGIATVGYVEEIEPVQEGFFVRFVYKDSRGDEMRKSVQVPASIFQERQITDGSQVTLLVSPDGENHVLPYFLASKYRVVPVEATQVSEEVSARIAAQELALPVQSFGRYGAVEREFLGSEPRVVRMTGERNRRRFWAVAAVPPLGFVIQLALTKGQALPYAERLLLPILAFGLGARLVKSFLSSTQSVGWLKNGVPARAIVLDEYVAPSSAERPENRTASFIYEYETSTGEKVTSNVALPVRQAWRLGFVKGATFTVLHNRTNPTDHTEYFLIKDAEIAGAMGAKITPP